MRLSNEWKDYECIDAGNGEKLERWKNVILRRPDPWALWTHKDTKEWHSYHAVYHRSDKGGGYWENKKTFPEYWTVEYKNLKLKVSPTGFKHTGLFPEQAANWDFIMGKIRNANRPIKVLNLFAYTGAATMAASSAGAVEVVHVDASKGMNDWAKENVKISNLDDKEIHFLVDDVKKFVQREIRRGNKYDAIIMDPPSYGRGSNGEVWSIEKDLNDLLFDIRKLLTDDFLFVCVNTYTANLSLLTLECLLKVVFKNNKISVDEIALPIEENNLFLPCGITGWIENE